MSTTVTAKEITAALQKNAVWMQQPEELRVKMQPFVDALPTVLAKFLSQTVTVETLLKAKAAYLRYCLENKKLVKALFGDAKKEKVVSLKPKTANESTPLDDSSLGDALVYAMSGMFQSTLELGLKQIEGLVGNLNEAFQETGLTERAFMTAPNIALSGKALELYDQGNLTFNELLRLQPMLVIKNT